MRSTCPECRTTFRVTQAQLGARRGLVRCGQCRAVFNAYDTLLPELEEAPGREVEAPPASGDEAPHAHDGLVNAAAPDSCAAADALPRPVLADVAVDDAGSGATSAVAPPGYPPVPSPADDQRRPSAPVDFPAHADAGTAAGPPVERRLGDVGAPDAREPPPDDSPDAILLSELPHRRPAAAPPWRAVAQWLAVIGLSGALLLQSILYLRGPVIDAYPAARPWLQALCEPLRCQVPLPRQLDKRALAASSLEHDPERKSRVRLTFLLTNPTGQVQTWPYVTLTLTDVRETPVARKLFPPEVYLPAEFDRAAGMPARAEREVRIDLDIGNLAASGYTLDVLYP